MRVLTPSKETRNSVFILLLCSCSPSFLSHSKESTSSEESKFLTNVTKQPREKQLILAYQTPTQGLLTQSSSPTNVREAEDCVAIPKSVCESVLNAIAKHQVFALLTNKNYTGLKLSSNSKQSSNKFLTLANLSKRKSFSCAFVP